MRQGPLYLLLTALSVTPAVHAEQSQPLALNPVPAATAPASDSAAQIAALQQQLADSESQREALQATAGERDSAQISRLRQDNQRLKLQLKQAQAQEPQRLLSEQQLWYLIGAGTALIAFVVGRLSGGRNKRRSEWV